MPLSRACAHNRPSSPEVTRVICRVPSTPFSQAPEYTQLVHLCRFRVRPVRWGSFPEARQTPSESDNLRQPQSFVTTSRLRNIDRISIDYAFRPRLRSRLTLRGLTLRRNPWTFGESVSHTFYRYSCQHSHFRYLHLLFRVKLHRLTERSATTHDCSCIHIFGTRLNPRYIFGAGRLN